MNKHTDFQYTVGIKLDFLITESIPKQLLKKCDYNKVKCIVLALIAILKVTVNKIPSLFISSPFISINAPHL